MYCNRIRLIVGAAAVLGLCLAPAMAVPVGTEILLDFGSSDTAPSSYGQWNTFASSPTVGTELADLIDKDGDGTGITMTATDDFAPSNLSNAGEWTDASVPWVDAQALGDYVLVRDSTGTTNDNFTGQIVFTGLESDKTYTFDLIGSRASTSANKEANYYINGLDSDSGNSLAYHATDNGYVLHEVMTWTAVAPVYNAASDTWQITLDMEIVSGSEFGYLNAGRITVAPVPEPATATLLGLGGLLGVAGLRRRRR